MLDYEARRSAFFSVTANSLYKKGVKSQMLVKLSKMVGCNMSSKTFLKNLRNAGLVNPRKMQIGLWAKRKIRGISVRLQNVVLAFSAWCNYVQAGLGSFNLEAVVAGVKPP